MPKSPTDHGTWLSASMTTSTLWVTPFASNWGVTE